VILNQFLDWNDDRSRNGCVSPRFVWCFSRGVVLEDRKCPSSSVPANGEETKRVDEQGGRGPL